MSEVKVNFRDAVIVRGSSLPIQTQIHGELKCSIVQDYTSV